jgi:hypothetical protein
MGIALLRAMPWLIRLLAWRGRVQCQANLSGIYTTQSDSRTEFFFSEYLGAALSV